MENFGERNIGPDTGKKEPSLEELRAQLVLAKAEKKRLPNSSAVGMKILILEESIKRLKDKQNG